jgi:hypothetical protein
MRVEEMAKRKNRGRRKKERREEEERGVMVYKAQGR